MTDSVRDSKLTQSIDVEYLDPKTVDCVLYHASCSDGFASALSAYLLLGNNAEYIPCSHKSSSVPDVCNKTVVVLDFSFNYDTTVQMIQKAKKFLVIDHHTSASERLRDIPDRNKIFDMTKSGALLSWMFFHPLKQIPSLFHYISDRDLWEWKLMHTNEITTGLDARPQTFDSWIAILNQYHNGIKQLRSEGQLIVNYRTSIISSISASSVQKMWIIASNRNGAQSEPLLPHHDQVFSCRVVNVNGPQLLSYVGDYMIQKFNEDLVVLWMVDNLTNQVTISMRSTDHVNCKNIAVHFGGGGHDKAASFTLPLTDLSDQLKELIFNK